jgi:hypothetical protein
MTQDAVVDWNAIFKKGVKSKDDVQVGTVVGSSETSVLIERGSTCIYTIPKERISAFDGNEILLDLTDQELVAYEHSA